MLSIIFATFLISDSPKPWFDPHIPDPYLGFGFSLNKQNISKGDDVTGTVTSHDSSFKMMSAIGVPFEVNHLEFEDFRPMRLILNPELLLGVDFFGFGLMFGPDMSMPIGDFQVPNGWFWGAQFGPFYSELTSEDLVQSKATTALVGSFYFGPQFDIRDKALFRFQINPKIYVGKIAAGFARSEWSDLMGLALFFNAQVQF